jgi:hypothetical protein
MFVCCDCCVLLGRSLCDGLITRPEQSYRLWRVVVCDQETSNTRRLKPATDLWKIQPQWVVTQGKQTNKQIFYCKIIRIFAYIQGTEAYSRGRGSLAWSGRRLLRKCTLAEKSSRLYLSSDSSRNVYLVNWTSRKISCNLYHF